MLGPTGSGKSHFVTQILRARVRRGAHVVMIATKRDDATLDALRWPIITKWPPSYRQTHVIFWVKSGLTRASRQVQREKIFHVLNEIWEPNSNRIVVFDEIAYVQHELGLGQQLTTYYREGRSLGITIVAATQRPQGITRWMHSETSWSVAFKPKDEDDAERVAQVLGSKRGYRDVLMDLDGDRHEFVLIRNRTGEAYISSMPFRSRS